MVDTDTSKETNLCSAATDVVELILKKNADYGDDNIKAFGEVGLLVRLSDKFARLKNIHGKNFQNESIEDTIDDIIGYALILKLLRRGQW